MYSSDAAEQIVRMSLEGVEDAAKIQRIMERFELTKVDKASVVSQVERDMEKKKAVNPDMARAEKE